MEYIKRYLYALKGYLPKENQEEIIKEVEANIYDMLNGDYSDEKVKKVLKELGHPRTLSQEYLPKKRYLIGPEYYYSYINTLLYVTILVGSIYFIISIFGSFFNKDTDISTFNYVLKTIGNAINSMFSGAFISALIVTVTYVAIERGDFVLDNKNNVIKKKDWDIEMLKEVPNKKVKEFKKSSLLTDIFFNLLFTVLFIFLAKYIGYYHDGKMTPLFVQSEFNLYIVPFLVMSFFLVIVNLSMIHHQYPNYKVAIIKTVYNVLNLVITLIFLFDRKLFNPLFKEEFAQLFKMTTDKFNSLWTSCISVIAFLTLIGIIANSLSLFYQSYKNANTK